MQTLFSLIIQIILILQLKPLPKSPSQPLKPRSQSSLQIKLSNKYPTMDSEPLTKLKKKLDTLKLERDQLNSEVLEERAKAASIEAEFARKQSDFLRAKQDLNEKEAMLDKFNFTLRESENTYTKLLLNTDRLYTALEQETANLRKNY